MAEHGRAVRLSARLMAGRERDRVRLEALRHAGREPEGRGGPGGESRAWRQAEQHGRAQLTGTPSAADGAALDVPVNALAQYCRQPPVPAGKQRAELSAVAAVAAADEQHGEADLKLVTGPGKQRMRMASRHA